jgi:hypothetical protein
MVTKIVLTLQYDIQHSKRTTTIRR